LFTSCSQTLAPAETNTLDDDQLVASTYCHPSWPLLTIGSEMSFDEVEKPICDKWIEIDELSMTHLFSLSQRLVLLKTVRDLWSYSDEGPSNNSPEALSSFEENSIRRKLFEKIDDSVLGVPVRVLHTVANQFIRLTNQWDKLRAPLEVRLALNVRALRLARMCKCF